MATTIDELVIVLGMDTAKFTQGQKDAIEGFKRSQDAVRLLGRDVEHEGARVGDVFQSLKREALGFLGLFLGGKGIKDFVSHVTQLDAATGRAAYTLNMSARELSAWEGAGASVGAQAGSITGSMQGLSGAMNQFMLTGQGPFLGVMSNLGLSLFDGNKKLKTAGEMFLEIADSVHKLNESDPARAAALLSMIPGANQDSINLMIKGRAAVEELVNASRKSAPSFDDIQKAQEYQKTMSQLDRTATGLGRTLTSLLAPGLIAVASAMTRLLESWKNNPAEDEVAGAKNRASMNKGLGDPKNLWRFLNKYNPFGVSEGQLEKELDEFYGSGTADERDKKALPESALKLAVRQKAVGAPDASIPTSMAEREARIRRIAAEEGVNPDHAVKVWEREGKFGVGPSQQSSVITKNGTREESYGPFQLYMNGGLGNKFQKETGLDPRDPSTFDAQVRFSMKEVKSSGWNAWHGARGLPFADMPAPGGAGLAARSRQSSNMTNSTNVSIAQLTINTKATDAEGIANEVPGALKRANWAASANFGLSG